MEHNILNARAEPEPEPEVEQMLGKPGGVPGYAYESILLDLMRAQLASF